MFATPQLRPPDAYSAGHASFKDNPTILKLMEKKLKYILIRAFVGN